MAHPPVPAGSRIPYAGLLPGVHPATRGRVAISPISPFPARVFLSAIWVAKWARWQPKAPRHDACFGRSGTAGKLTNDEQLLERLFPDRSRASIPRSPGTGGYWPHVVDQGVAPKP